MVPTRAAPQLHARSHAPSCDPPSDRSVSQRSAHTERPCWSVVFREATSAKRCSASSRARSNSRRRTGSSQSWGPRMSSERWRWSTPPHAWRPRWQLPTACWQCSTSTGSTSWSTKPRHSRCPSCRQWLTASGRMGEQVRERGIRDEGCVERRIPSRLLDLPHQVNVQGSEHGR